MAYATVRVFDPALLINDMSTIRFKKVNGFQCGSYGQHDLALRN